MPGLPFQQNELLNLALSFTTSLQPPNPLYGCLAALDGICIEVQKPRTCTDTEIVSRLSSSAELGKMRQVRRKRTRVAVCLCAQCVLSFRVHVQTKRAARTERRATFIISVQCVQTFLFSMERPRGMSHDKARTTTSRYERSRRIFDHGGPCDAARPRRHRTP
jgi:hypothetical protein